jgi:bifunctional DNase/RNase
VSEDYVRVEIQKVIGPTTAAGAAVLLGNDDKSFVVFIGMNEALAIRRELENEAAQRPLTHDLIQSVLLGFDLAIRQIVITRIIDNAFCATLILEQKVPEESGSWAGRRNEVRIDARPSDCLVLALKNRSEIQVTREVFDQVQDVSHLTVGDLALELPPGVGPDLLSWGTDPEESEGKEEDDDDS